MDFFLIMGIGTVVAIIVVANLPKSGHILYDKHQDPFACKKPPQTLASQTGISEVWATDDMDYLNKLEHHERDPHHCHPTKKCSFSNRGVELGIGRFMLDFRSKNIGDLSNKINHFITIWANFFITLLLPFTEGFTETFIEGFSG